MISQLLDIFRTHSEWFRSPDSNFSFVKVSTPASGTKTGNGKVLLFVFEDEQKTPTLCVKTVRASAGAEIVKQNNENLLRLQKGVDGTELTNLFAKPLYFHSDTADVFCIESVCPGEKFSMKKQDFSVVIKKYSAWQAHISKMSTIFFDKENIKKLVDDTLMNLPISANAVLVLKKYYESLPVDEHFKLPALVQHGDLTPDNVLISGDDVYFVDYDYVGLSELPGFDLFHFLSKSKSRIGTLRENCNVYFPLYFKAIGATVESHEALLFLYYLQESVRKGVGEKTEEEIIANFKYLLER